MITPPHGMAGINSIRSLNDISSFPRTNWGIPEPDFINPSTGEARVNAMDCRPPALNVILVPGLGFDNHCRRLGRGKGFYDRYLSRFSAKTGSMPLLIAPAFECQVVVFLGCSWKVYRDLCISDS